MMRYKFALRNVETGESRLYEEVFDWSEESQMLFQWTQGNYSCDCNRGLFLYNWDDAKEVECSGHDNTIALDAITREDGTSVDMEQAA